MKPVRDRAVAALEHALAGASGRAELGPDGYAITTEANLLHPLLPETQADFAAGAGRELDGSMRAPHSSAALAVNVFEPWRARPEHLELAGIRSFETIEFEKQLPTGLGGIPPHLDLVAEAGDAVVAVESKCLEYLTPKIPRFRSSYRTLDNLYGRRSWFRYVAEEATSAQNLDVAQLVKHWLGLCRAYPDRRSDRRVTLLYLYWEPENWQHVPECCRHRREIQDFADRVAGDPVRFSALSYPELWTRWQQRSAAPWVTEHVARLRQRYAVAI